MKKSEELKNGDIVKVTHNCVPAGLVPNMYVVLHYKYATEGSTKWYAIPTESREYVGILDSHKVYLLKPETV